MDRAHSEAEAGNRARFSAQKRNLFETWYLKWNHLESETAGWIRYTLFHSDSRPSEAAVWAIFVDARHPERTVCIKQNHPLADVALSDGGLRISIGKDGASGIRHGEAWGHVKGGGSEMSWRLASQGEATLVKHIPWPLYSMPVPTTKFLAPHCWYPASGTVTVDGRRIDLDRVPAHQAHFWGTRQAHAWTWGNCSTFREDPDFGFEGISGRVKVGPLHVPAMSSFSFRWEGVVHRSNQLLRSWLNRSRSDLTEWRFSARAGGLRFVGALSARPDEMILYRHVDPDGAPRHSHNHFFADLDLRIERKQKGGWREIKRLTAERSAAFEVAQSDRDPRVTRFIQP